MLADSGLHVTSLHNHLELCNQSSSQPTDRYCIEFRDEYRFNIGVQENPCVGRDQDEQSQPVFGLQKQTDCDDGGFDFL